MKHYVNAKLGSDEFREKFEQIRDEFVSKLDHHIAGRVVSAFRACDSDGKPFAWVWDDAEFKYAHTVGNTEDAKGFMCHMIDEGMRFAFMGVPSVSGIDVWLTTWEGHEHGPTWPSGCTPIFEEVHEGVCIGTGE